MLPNMPFGGTPIRTVPEFSMVRRTWRERLLTRPWRPWVARKQIRNPFAPPSGEVFIANGTIICTDRQREQLRAALKSTESERDAN